MAPVSTNVHHFLGTRPRRRGRTQYPPRTDRARVREQGTFGRMIGNSPEMRKVYQTVEQAAPTAASVLIGESGPARSWWREAIHQLRPAGGPPFLPVNCAAIPNAGRERAVRPRARRLHRRGGSAAGLLRAGRRRHAVPRRDRRDDAGDAGKPLRVLEERHFQRVGGRIESVDVRGSPRARGPADAVITREAAGDVTLRTTGPAVRDRAAAPRHRMDDVPVLIQ